MARIVAEAAHWQRLRLRLAIGTLCVLLVGAFVILLPEIGSQRLLLAFADDQTEFFEQMRQQALNTNRPEDAVRCLAGTVDYYPSGTKQSVGSRLDRVVERARASAVREIIAHLKVQSHQDLGPDPQAWIVKFGGH